MNKKQKKALWRIIAAAVMTAALELLPAEGWVKLALYIIPYMTVGYETLIKAFKGIKNRQPFDENFLMAVATVGAVALGDYKEGVAVMIFPWERAAAASPSSWTSAPTMPTLRTRAGSLCAVTRMR